MEFEAFPKIGRLSRECVITEKLDGTNAQIYIEHQSLLDSLTIPPVIAFNDDYAMFAGSRTRYITPSSDNFGFANWVAENAAELFKLGPGRHFGEWWGQGIQRGYGLKEKRFSLFNTHRWRFERPSCCHVVPILYAGDFQTSTVDYMIENLRREGSTAAPGFMAPEGVVVFHTATSTMFKKTLLKDESPKGKVA